MDPFQRFLLDLFTQVANDPESRPQLPIDRFEDGSDERQLLVAFEDMLERLGESRNRLRDRYEQLVNSIDGIVWVADPDTVKFSFVSQQTERLLGYSASDWLSQPAFWQDHMHPEDRAWAIPFCAAATAEKRPHEFEYRMIAADGRIVWLRDIVSVIVEGGQPARLRDVMVDISERKRAEATLEALRRQHELILNSAGEGTYGVDRDGRTTFVNPAATRMLGWEPEVLVGTFAHDLVHHSRPDGTPYPSQECPIHAATLQHGATHVVDTEVFWRKDGTSFPVQYISTPIWEQGEITGAVVTFHDVSERRRAEERLREKEAQYRRIFEATSDGLVINDLETGIVIACNPAFARMHGGTVADFLGVHPTTFIHPDCHHLFVQYVETIKAGSDFRAQATDVRRDGTHFPVEVHGTGFTYMGKPAILGVVRDFTEHQQAAELLREKEEQYRSVFEASSDGLFINSLEGRFVDFNPAAARMHGYTIDEFRSLQPADFVHPSSYHLFQEYIQTVRAGKRFRCRAVDVRKDGSLFHVEVVGQGFSYGGKPHTLALVRDVTEEVEAYKLLERRVAERTSELATLLEVSKNVASTLELRPLLDLILVHLLALASYQEAVVAILEGDELVIAAYRGERYQEHIVGLREPVRGSDRIWGQLQARDAIIIGDLHGDNPTAQEFRRSFGGYLDATLTGYASCVLVPLVARERVIGFLALYHRELEHYAGHHASLVLAIADQAAVAIEKARLYEQAQTLAVLEERQRLARELHDSVSQALYGIGLGARTARTLLERRQEGVAEALEYITSLAAAGLAEMRALIFELRPESLETDGLVAALAKQAAALQARHQIEVLTDLPAEPELPIEVKEVLYRIAQEALHNTVKHAQARQVYVGLAQTHEGVVLDLRDDGIGFDPAGSYPGHLGLRSMRERVARLGGLIRIESGPGRGTAIRVQLPSRRGRTDPQADSHLEG